MRTHSTGQVSPVEFNPSLLEVFSIPGMFNAYNFPLPAIFCF